MWLGIPMRVVVKLAEELVVAASVQMEVMHGAAGRDDWHHCNNMAVTLQREAMAHDCRVILRDQDILQQVYLLGGVDTVEWVLSAQHRVCRAVCELVLVMLLADSGQHLIGCLQCILFAVWQLRCTDLPNYTLQRQRLRYTQHLCDYAALRAEANAAA